MAGGMMTPATPMGRRVRVAGWLGFIFLVAIGEAIMLSPLSAPERQIATDIVTYLTPIFLAFVAACHLTLRLDGVERRLWGLTALASGLLLCSETYVSWYFYAVDWRGPQLPAAFELLQLGAALSFMAIVATMTAFGQTPFVTRARLVVDVAAAMVVATAATYWWVMLPLYSGVPRGGWQVAAVTAVYPVVGVLLLVGAGVMVFGWRAYRWRSWERLLVGALAFYGVGMLFEPVWYAEAIQAPFPSEGGILSNLFGFGFYLLFMAMVYRATSQSDTSAAERWPVPQIRSRWFPTAYPVVIAFALPVMGLACLRIGHLPEGAFVVALTSALGILLVGRAWLSSLERIHLHGLTITDPVSGAFNHRYLHERLAETFARASLGQKEAALIVFDVDDFGHVNRVWGHQRGDELLRGVAEQIAAHASVKTTVYRIGSDEFAVLLSEATAEEAVEHARRTQSRVASAPLLPTSPITLSAGIAFYPRDGADVDQIVAHALAAQQLARATESPDPVVYDEELVGSVDPAERLTGARRRSHRAVVLALAEAVDDRYTYTKEHSENVAELAVSLAQVLGLSDESVRAIGLAAHVHDLGKIGVRDEVLLKEGPLSADERKLMEEHPVLGERILAPTELEEVLPLVRHHHERWDGEGYPDGLRGPQIPVGSRILSVCDAFEAMTSERPFRAALTFEAAIEQLETCSGSQFDPEVAGAFVRMVTHLRTPVADHVALSMTMEPGHLPA
jgi:diguanylate cyclase (GGDEF)-like protein